MGRWRITFFVSPVLVLVAPFFCVNAAVNIGQRTVARAKSPTVASVATCSAWGQPKKKRDIRICKKVGNAAQPGLSIYVGRERQLQEPRHVVQRVIAEGKPDSFAVWRNNIPTVPGAPGSVVFVKQVAAPRVVILDACDAMWSLAIIFDEQAPTAGDERQSFGIMNEGGTLSVRVRNGRCQQFQTGTHPSQTGRDVDCGAGVAIPSGSDYVHMYTLDSSGLQSASESFALDLFPQFPDCEGKFSYPDALTKLACVPCMYDCTQNPPLVSCTDAAQTEMCMQKTRPFCPPPPMTIDALRTLCPAAVPAPTVPAPTVPAPTVPAPTVPAPTVPAPTVPAPTVPAPTVPAPTVPAPTVPAPTVPAPTVPAPTVPAPTVPAPTVPAPTVPAPTVPAPEPRTNVCAKIGDDVQPGLSVYAWRGEQQETRHLVQQVVAGNGADSFIVWRGNIPTSPTASGAVLFVKRVAAPRVVMLDACDAQWSLVLVFREQAGDFAIINKQGELTVKARNAQCQQFLTGTHPAQTGRDIDCSEGITVPARSEYVRVNAYDRAGAVSTSASFRLGILPRFPDCVGTFAAPDDATAAACAQCTFDCMQDPPGIMCADDAQVAVCTERVLPFCSPPPLMPDMLQALCPEPEPVAPPTVPAPVIPEPMPTEPVPTEPAPTIPAPEPTVPAPAPTVPVPAPPEPAPEPIVPTPSPIGPVPAQSCSDGEVCCPEFGCLTCPPGDVPICLSDCGFVGPQCSPDDELICRSDCPASPAPIACSTPRDVGNIPVYPFAPLVRGLPTQLRIVPGNIPDGQCVKIDAKRPDIRLEFLQPERGLPMPLFGIDTGSLLTAASLRERIAGERVSRGVDPGREDGFIRCRDQAGDVDCADAVDVDLWACAGMATCPPCPELDCSNCPRPACPPCPKPPVPPSPPAIDCPPCECPDVDCSTCPVDCERAKTICPIDCERAKTMCPVDCERAKMMCPAPVCPPCPKPPVPPSPPAPDCPPCECPELDCSTCPTPACPSREGLGKIELPCVNLEDQPDERLYEFIDVGTEGGASFVPGGRLRVYTGKIGANEKIVVGIKQRTRLERLTDATGKRFDAHEYYPGCTASPAPNCGVFSRMVLTKKGATKVHVSHPDPTRKGSAGDTHACQKAPCDVDFICWKQVKNPKLKSESIWVKCPCLEAIESVCVEK